MSVETIDVLFDSEQIRGVYNYSPYKKMIAGLSDIQADIARTKAWEKDVLAGGRVDDGESPVLGFMKDAYDIITTASAFFVNHPIDSKSFDTWIALRDMFCAATRLSVFPGYTCPTYPNVNVKDMVIATAEAADILFRLIDPILSKTAPPVPDEKKMQSRYASIYMDIVCGRSVFWIAYIDAIGNQLSAMYGMDWHEVLNNYSNARFIACCSELMGRMSCNEDVAVTALSAAASACGYMYDTRQAQVYAFDCPGVTNITEQVKATYLANGVDEAFPNVSVPYFKPGNDERGYCKLAKIPPIGAVISLPDMLEKRFRVAFMEMRANAEKLDEQ